VADVKPVGRLDDRQLPDGVVAITATSLNLPLKIDMTRRGAYAPPVASRIELFQGDVRLMVTRLPENGFANGTLAGSFEDDRELTIQLNPQDFPDLAAMKDIWVGGYFAQDWAYEAVPVVRIDEASRRITGDRLLTPFAPRKSFRVAVFNSVGALDRPGRFVIDKQTQRALILPVAGEPPIEAAVANQALLVKDAKHIRIERIAIEKTLDTSVAIEDSDDVVIRDCYVGHSGGDGMTVTRGEGVRIIGCVISDVLERGVVLAGGDRRTLHGANHEIVDSVVADFARASRTYKAGVQMSGVGLTASGDLITNSPHVGLMISGNENSVDHCEFSDLLTETDDAGAIYMGRDWTQRGNRFSSNYFHSLGLLESSSKFQQVAIYLDDQISGALIDSNVFFGASFGVVIGGGRDNLVENNVFIAQRRAGISFDDRGLKWQKSYDDDSTDLAKNLRKVDIQSPAWRERYPELAEMPEHSLGAPLHDVVRDNYSIGSPVVLAQSAAARSFLMEEGSQTRSFKQLDDASPQTLDALIKRIGMSNRLVISDRRSALSGLLFFPRAVSFLSTH
jgi:hypothetical protein